MNMPTEIRDTIKGAIAYTRHMMILRPSDFTGDHRQKIEAAFEWLEAHAQPQAAGGVYSHRNGETEPPTIYEQHFWFIAVPGSWCEATFGCFYIMPPEQDRGPYTDRREIPIADLEGRWWGPVTPPWETSQRPQAQGSNK